MSLLRRWRRACLCEKARLTAVSPTNTRKPSVRLMPLQKSHTFVRHLSAIPPLNREPLGWDTSEDGYVGCYADSFHGEFWCFLTLFRS